MTVCLLHNESASYCKWQGEALLGNSRSESEYEMCVKSLAVDQKPGELPMARLKLL